MQHATQCYSLATPVLHWQASLSSIDTLAVAAAGQWSSVLAAEQADSAKDPAGVQGGNLLPVQACRAELSHAVGLGVVGPGQAAGLFPTHSC